MKSGSSEWIAATEGHALAVGDRVRLHDGGLNIDYASGEQVHCVDSCILVIVGETGAADAV